MARMVILWLKLHNGLFVFEHMNNKELGGMDDNEK